MIHLIKETLLLLPFLFVTYLILEAIEARAGGALEKFLERSRSVGPLAGGLLGAIPQCGISAMAASFYAGGILSLGTLLATFLSTSDELIPVLLSSSVPISLIFKIVIIKVVASIVVGFLVSFLLYSLKKKPKNIEIQHLCKHSHCQCHKHKGIVVPALIHTLEIFFFIVVVSIALYLVFPHCCEDHCCHSSSLYSEFLKLPIVGEFLGALIGLIPNCAASVTSARLYAEGVMSSGALMASSFTGCGVGLLVLFRVNRNLKENLLILIAVYFIGTFLGWLSGFIL